MNPALVQGIATALIVAASAQAQIRGTYFGTAAPPATIDGYTLETPTDLRPPYALANDAPIGGGRETEFDRTLSVRRIGVGWPSWSHGYDDEVYATAPTDTQVVLGFPEGEVGAIVLYVQPMAAGTHGFEIEAQSADGDIDVLGTLINPITGAKGFAFSTTGADSITSVRITNTDGLATGFAVGEFRSAPVKSRCMDWTYSSFDGTGQILNVPITVNESCRLFKITDLQRAGDRFRVRFRKGGDVVRTITTSAPTRTGDYMGMDYDAAYEDPRWSSGAVMLDPGNYMMQISPIEAPFGAGRVGYSLDVAHPCGYGKCPADFNGNGVIDLFDFLGFQNAFDAQQDCADIDGDGELTVFDFLAFQNLFDSGC